MKKFPPPMHAEKKKGQPAQHMATMAKKFTAVEEILRKCGKYFHLLFSIYVLHPFDNESSCLLVPGHISYPLPGHANDSSTTLFFKR